MGLSKAYLTLHGKPLLLHVLSRIDRVFDCVLVVVDGGELPFPVGVPVVTDIVPGKGPLGGLYTGLTHSSAERNFVCACDMPYLNPQLLAMLKLLSPNYDVTVPMVRGFLEPLHAVYAKSCLSAVEVCLKRDCLRLKAFYPSMSVCIIPEDTVREKDPSLRSLVNINTREELSYYEAYRPQARAGRVAATT
jgi:molybdopterin-guanine dinucleotide biosynthesis protein A